MSKFLTAVFVIAIGLVSPSPVLGKKMDSLLILTIPDNTEEANYAFVDRKDNLTTYQKWSRVDNIISIYRDDHLLYRIAISEDGKDVTFDVGALPVFMRKTFSKTPFELRDGEVSKGTLLLIDRTSHTLESKEPMTMHSSWKKGKRIITYKMNEPGVNSVNQTVYTFDNKSQLPKRIDNLRIVNGKVLTNHSAIRLDKFGRVEKD